MKSWLMASIAILLGAAPWLSSRAANLQVYRCTGDDGAVSLQDTPCPRGQEQESRSIRRPVDASPPPRSAPTAPASPPADAPASQELRVTLVEPQPLYDCQRHDGSTYESDTGIPERRWVPLWVLGMDPRAPPRTFGAVGRPRPAPPLTQPRAVLPPADPNAYALGTWVEDRCYRAPAAVACERRRQRLSEFGRRIFNAQQREGDRLKVEERGLREQLRQECGIG